MQGLWGDGFVDDSLLDCLSMVDWDACSADQYAVFFPRLVVSNNKPSRQLILHLSSCVSARLWRLEQLDPTSPAFELRSCVTTGDTDLHRAWFADAGFLDGFLRGIGLRRTLQEHLERERRLLLLLDGVLDDVQRGSAPGWTQDLEAWFAFGSGIHPAYLWAESAISPARGCTAAWLGHLDRGRTALVPLAVAEYLIDAVLGSSNAIDAPLAAMVEVGSTRRLARAASQRLAGCDVTMRFNHHRRATSGDLRPAAVLRKVVLRHA